MGFSANKLRVNLKLTMNRLKLLEKKKTEIAQKSRKEIAEYLTQSKDDRARIRVEHIIREDYLVEAMELLELYADLLLARMGLIETMKYCDEGLVESVSTLIWAAPRLQSEVKELRIVSDQLGQKYGKQFAQDAASNSNKTVNERLIQKLNPKAPPKVLVERYLIEIARSHNVPFEPDPLVMEDSLDPDDDVSSKNFTSGGGGDDSNFHGSSGYGGSAGGPPGGGNSNFGPGGSNFGGSGGGGPNFGGSGGPNFGGSGGPNVGGPNFGGSGGPNFGGSGGPNFGGGGGPGGGANRPIGLENFGNPNQPMSLPTMPSVPPSNAAMAYPPPTVNPPAYPPPSHVSLPPSQPQDLKAYPSPGYEPRYTPEPTGPPVNPPHQGPSRNSAPVVPPSNNMQLPNVPDLPDVPMGSLPGGKSTVGGASAGDDLDFDDLNRRFEELKKKK